jgi:Putative auto-transporter adhesin, head GIN domain
MTTAPTSLPRGRTPHPLRVIGFAVLGVLVAAGIVLVARSERDTSPSGPGNVVEGSGTAVTEIRKVAPFMSVDLAGANNVSISIGTEQSVSVQADDNLINLVTTEVRAGELVIENHGNFRTESPMSVEVTLPQLNAVTMSGSGTLTVQGVGAERLTVRLPGSGVIRVSGATVRLTAELVGSGELRLNNLIAAQATAVVSGSGLIRLSASEALNATVSGTGTISYKGNPSQVTKSVTGSGAIIEQ